MVTETIIHQCNRCASDQIIKNGQAASGKQKYHCKACGFYGTLNPTVAYPPERRAEILRAYHERSSLRGLERIFGVARQTVAQWLREEDADLPVVPPLDDPLPDDVLELDELWSYVGSKKNKRWVWIALCRRTRQIVSYFSGGRTQEDCWRLWSWLPPDYRHCATFSDFWETYDAVFGRLGTDHQSVGKETGQTAHVVHEVGVSPTLEQHPAPTAGTLCPQDTFIFQDRRVP